MPSLNRTAPMAIICPFCYNLVVTRTHSIVTNKTHSVALVLCILCLWPLAAGVYCLKCMKDTAHYCPECNALIGVHERFNNQHDASINFQLNNKKGLPLVIDSEEKVKLNEMISDEISYDYVHPLNYFFTNYKASGSRPSNVADLQKYNIYEHNMSNETSQDNINFVNTSDNAGILMNVEKNSANKPIIINSSAPTSHNLHIKFDDLPSNLSIKMPTKQKNLNNVRIEIPEVNQTTDNKSVEPDRAETLFKRTLFTIDSDFNIDTKDNTELNKSVDIVPTSSELLKTDDEQLHRFTDRTERLSRVSTSSRVSRVSMFEDHIPLRSSIEFLESFKLKPVQSLDEKKEMEIYYDKSKLRSSTPQISKEIIKTKRYSEDETVLPKVSSDTINNDMQMLKRKPPTVILFKEAFTQTSREIINESELCAGIGKKEKKLSLNGTNNSLQAKLKKNDPNEQEEIEFLFENMETPVDSEVSIITEDGSFYSALSYSDSILNVLSDNSITSSEEEMKIIHKKNGYH